MQPEIEILADIPNDLAAVTLAEPNGWIGVDGDTNARDLIFSGHRVPVSIACRFPRVCALDRETAALVDARTTGRRINAWIVSASGERISEFHVGDAVESIAAVGGRLVVTHYDESCGSALHGALVFDRTGKLLLHYTEDLPDALDVVDCYALGRVGNDTILLFVYPDFNLAEVHLTNRLQRVWPTPESVHGASAISADGPTIFFHRPYHDKSGVYAWTRGESTASRVGSFDGSLEGLVGGWFLGKINDQHARLRFDASASERESPNEP